MQSWVLDDYEAFLTRVSEARGKTREESHEVAQGRVWSGRDALSHGLVDELGGLERAVAIAREKAGFDESDHVEVVVYPKKRNFLEVLVSELRPSRARETMSAGRAELAFSRWLETSVVLRSFRSTRSLAWMPFQLQVR